MSPPRTVVSLLTAVAACCGAAVAQHAVADGPGHPTANVCINCHTTLEGPLAKAVGDWQTSSHAKHGITCDGCHRGDPTNEADAKSPSTGYIGVPRIREVPYFCGRCHEKIKENYLGSPHGALGLPNCVTCHGSHTVHAPDPKKIISEAACTKCHKFDAPEKAQQALTKARSLLVDIDALAGEIHTIPAVREHLEVAQREMHLDHAGVLATFHSFRIGDIERMSMNVDRLRKTLARLEERETKRQKNVARERPMILVLMGFLVVATLFGFAVYRHAGEVEPGK